LLTILRPPHLHQRANRLESAEVFPHHSGDGLAESEDKAMSDRQPWSVRGVSKEARAKAARAAHHKHMTIGEWLSQTIIAAANKDLGKDGAAAENASLPATQDRTGKLAGALGALVTHLEKGGGGGNQALTQKIDRTEAVLTGRMEQIAAAMYGVMQTVEKQGARDIGPDPQQQAMAVEQARIAEQLAEMTSAEARRQEQMGAIADALTMLAGKVEASPLPTQPVPEPVITRPGSTTSDSFEYVGSSTMKPTPRHHDPHAEEAARQIREAAESPPSMPDKEDNEPRRRGLFGRLRRRKD